MNSAQRMRAQPPGQTILSGLTRRGRVGCSEWLAGWPNPTAKVGSWDDPTLAPTRLQPGNE